jgi:anti-sigma factor ChrR (cupin superfamily)
MIHLDEGKLLCVRCDELPWQPSTCASGVSVRNVACAGGFEMQLVRFDAGARFPVHTHELPEFIYVLEGELSIAGQALGPGWASIASKGSMHADVHSSKGCTFMLVDRPA